MQREISTSFEEVECVLVERPVSNVVISIEDSNSKLLESGTLFKYKGAEVTKKELSNLREHACLNDTVVHFQSSYLKTQSSESSETSCYIFNSFFFTALHNGKELDYERVRKWTKYVDLFSTETVIVPVNANEHWFLLVVLNLPQLGNAADHQALTLNLRAREKPTIIFFDSVKAGREKNGRVFGNILREYLCREWMSRKSTSYRSRKSIPQKLKMQFRISIASVPAQTNDVDCALYMLKNMSLILGPDSRNKLLQNTRPNLLDAYVEDDIEKLRNEIIDRINDMAIEAKADSSRDDSFYMLQPDQLQQNRFLVDWLNEKGQKGHFFGSPVAVPLSSENLFSARKQLRCVEYRRKYRCLVVVELNQRKIDGLWEVTYKSLAHNHSRSNTKPSNRKRQDREIRAIKLSARKATNSHLAKPVPLIPRPYVLLGESDLFYIYKPSRVT